MDVLKEPLEANPDHTIILSFQTSIMMVITRMLRRYLLSFNWKDAPVLVGRRAGQSSFFYSYCDNFDQGSRDRNDFELVKKEIFDNI